MSSTDQIIKRALDNTTLNTIDTVLGIVVDVKGEHSGRVDDYEVGADDALADVIRRLHLLQLKLKEGNSEL